MQIHPHAIQAMASVFLASSLVTLGIRLYVRKCLIKALGIDDYFMIAACATFTAFNISELIAISHGYGKHRTGPGGINNDTNAEKALMGFWLCAAFYAFTTSLLKISVGFFLLRVASHRSQVLVIKFFIAGSMVCGSAYFLLVICQCRPASYWWNLDPTRTGTCINALAFSIASWIISILNSAADIAFAVIPMILVATTATGMEMRTRVMVCLLLGIASIAGIVTIMRFPYLHNLNHYKGDFAWTTANVAALSTLEVGLGITAANMATLRPLMKRWKKGSARESGGSDQKFQFPATIGSTPCKIVRKDDIEHVTTCAASVVHNSLCVPLN